MTMYRKTGEGNELQAMRSAPFSAQYREEDLEGSLERNPQVIAEGEPLLWISRQPNANESGIPDLLALDADGNVVIVELKQGRTPRDVIAQALEYAAWAAALDEETLKRLAEEYLDRQAEPVSLIRAWEEAFGPADGDEGERTAVLPSLNRQQRLVLVLEGRDERVRNVTAYLRRKGIDINVIEYLFYRTESGKEFLDMEAVYAAEEADSGRPDELSLVREWSAAEQESVSGIQEHTAGRGRTRSKWRPTKTGISFYKQTRDGRRFIGTDRSFTRARCAYGCGGIRCRIIWIWMRWTGR